MLELAQLLARPAACDMNRDTIMVAPRSPCDIGVIRSTRTETSTLSSRQKRLTLAATILGSSMAFIDSSVVNVGLPAIQSALDADAAATSWVVNAYLLLLGAFVLVGGSAADIYGRRRIFLAGIAVFTAASIACGLAPNITVLIASRAVQGFGAALLTPASLAMLGAAFPDNERSRAIGLWAGFGALTAAAGPVLGGWLVDQVSWRAIFLLNVPLAIASGTLAVLFACESRDPESKTIDWKGAAMIVLSLACITWALGAIAKFGFADVTVLGASGVGIAAFLGFIAVEARDPTRAMMPLVLFRSRNFSGANGLTLLLYFALGGTLYFLPFGLIRLGEYTATQAGAALLPLALILGLGSYFAGGFADRFGPRISLALGPVVAACGLALLAVVDFGASYWTGVFPSVCILAIGMTATVAPLTASVMDSVGGGHVGIASGVNNAVARIAGLFAVAVLGAVLFASFSYFLGDVSRIQAGDALNAVMSGHASGYDAASAAFRHALQTVMWTAACSAAVGGGIGWLSIRS
jgi:EmrB/QacA subfamily drug resistance transporter